MKHLTCQDIELLLPATAAGALDGDEAQTVKAHLALCPPCLKHLHDYQETVEQLAYTVPQVAPSALLRDRVLGSLSTAPEVVMRAPGVASRNGSRPPVAMRSMRPPSRLGQVYRRVAPAALAACLILLIGSGVWMGVMTQQLDFATRSMQQQASMRDLLRAPGAEMAPLKSTKAGSTAGGQAIMAPGRNQVAIMATHLPPLPSGRGYQLWLLQHGNTLPIRAAQLSVDGSGVLMNVVYVTADPSQMAGMRITDEPLSGSDTPTGQSWLEGWYR